MQQDSFQQHSKQLDQLLDHPSLVEDGLTCLECQGLLTANAILPAFAEEAISKVAIGESELPDSFPLNELAALLKQLSDHIQRQLYLAEPPLLPFQDEEESQWLTAAEEWCTGFMTAVFEQEARWFDDKDHQEVSELLLPIMVLSGLFNDQKEFAEMQDDEDLIDDMLGQLPEVVTELYLIFQAPEEKPSFHKQKKKKK